MRKLGALLGLALSVTFAGQVYAQEAEPVADPMATPASTEPMAQATVTSTGVPQALVARGVQGPAGQLWIRTLVGINASKGFFAKPFSIAPDVFYGVSDKLQVGLVHNGPLGWQTPGFFPSGLCLAGKENGCPKVYNNVGFDALYSLMTGSTDLSFHGAVYLRSSPSNRCYEARCRQQRTALRSC